MVLFFWDGYREHTSDTSVTPTTVWAASDPSGRQWYLAAGSPGCVESVRRSCVDWRDVTPEQDALLQQHTIQTRAQKKEKLDQEG